MEGKKITEKSDGLGGDLQDRFNSALQMNEEEKLLKSPSPLPQNSELEGGFTKIFTKGSMRRFRRNAIKEKFSADAEPSSSGKPLSTVVAGKPQKNKRQDTDPEEGPSQQRPAKRPSRGEPEGPRNAAKARSELAVYVARGDGKPLDEAAATLVRSRLVAHLRRAVDEELDDDKLSFATSGLVAEGFFLVTPMTEGSKEWLLSLELGTHDGVELIIRPLNRAKVAVWIPGAKEERPEDPLRMLKVQNKSKELQLSEWTLITRESYPLGERLVVGVPQELAERGVDFVTLNYEFTQVHARFIKSKAPESTGKEKTDTRQGPVTDVRCKCKCSCTARASCTESAAPEAGPAPLHKKHSAEGPEDGQTPQPPDTSVGVRPTD